MDSIKAIVPDVKVQNLTSKAGELLAKLEQAGLFRALVIQRQGNQVVLDTSYGRLTGKASVNLNKGDEILARLVSAQQQPTIKVEQHQRQLITIPRNALPASFDSSSDKPVLVKVISHSKHSTQLQLPQQMINVPRQNLLQAGETLLLQTDKNSKQVSVVRLQPEAVLKQALNILMPRNLNNTQQHNLTSLNTLAARLIAAQPPVNQNQSLQSVTTLPDVKPDTNTTALTRSGNNASGENANRIPASNTVSAEVKPSINAPTRSVANDSSNQLEQLINQVARPLLKMDSLKPMGILQAMQLLSLVKLSPGTASLHTKMGVPETLKALATELRNKPELFDVLLSKILTKSAIQNKTAHSENLLPENSHQLRNELLQQTEHTLNQLLTQKTSVRLQAEQQQPIQFYLNIPVQVENETTNLSLKIKQRNAQNEDASAHWEMDLEFEFGLLGLISTHILLQDKKLSAHFWAVETATKQLIDSNLNQFKNQLQKSGFEPGLFECYLGQPQKQSEEELFRSDGLLDIKV